MTQETSFNIVKCIHKVLSEEPETKEGLVKGIAKKLEKHLDKVSEIRQKAETVQDTLEDTIGQIKDQGSEHISIAKELAGWQANSLKSEAEFMKKIFKSKDLVFIKTDALAIVLRKLGGNEEFFKTVDELTKEGYRLVHQENVRNIPIGAGFNYPLGNMYYFQHIKYIGKT